MKAQIITTTASDGTRTTYLQGDEINLICHDLDDAVKIAIYLGYRFTKIKDDTIYLIK